MLLNVGMLFCLEPQLSGQASSHFGFCYCRRSSRRESSKCEVEDEMRSIQISASTIDCACLGASEIRGSSDWPI